MDKVLELIEKEKQRQQETLMLIPSENYTYPEVRAAVGSVLMHKYAEGQPGKRYYQGNRIIDEIESLCETRALKAFGLSAKDWSVNVQPHSGCEANLAVYNSILNPGDKILSMYLPDGGHLSHGWFLPDKRVTLVSKIYEVEFYHVDPKTKVFDYDQIEKQAFKFKPKLLVSGGTAYPREIDYREMAAIAHRAGAYYLADVAHEAGLIIGGANQSPFPFADFVSLTTHKTLRGPRGAMVICRKELAEKLDASVFPGLQGGPHLHTIAGIAVALAKSQTPDFRQYALQTVKNARFLAAFLQKKGLEVVSGGTEKHLVLVDLRNTGVSGWTVAWALERAGICANRNTVPQENASPFYPSGLRLGTPAVTVRGMKEPEMAQIGEWILKAINHVKGQKIPENQDQRRVFLKNFLTEVKKDKFLQGINREVKKLCQKFPIR